MKILICEDEEIMLTALEFRLKKHRFDVDLAKDGNVALEKIKADKPDMVIVDILMPEVSGLEVIDYIRKDLKSEIPIIVISALEHDEILMEAFQKGANDFISKPFKPVELLLRIKRIFQERAATS